MNHPPHLHHLAALLAINFLYALVMLANQRVALLDKASLGFYLGLAGVFLLFGLYALLWQQVLKRIPLTAAYMFKGTSLLFVLLLSVLFLGDVVTLQNLIGAGLIVGGIVLFNYSKS